MGELDKDLETFKSFGFVGDVTEKQSTEQTFDLLCTFLIFFGIL